MRGHFVQFSIATLLTLLLTACGGGGSGADGGVLGGSGTAGAVVEPTASITLTIFDASGNSTSQVSGDVPVILRAVLLGSDGAPLQNRVVTFESAVGQISPSSATDLTDANGVAEVQLGAGQVAIAGSVSASSSVSGVTATFSANIQSDWLATTVDTEDGTIDPPPTITLTVLDVDGNVTDQVAGNTPVTVSVLLETSTGAPIVGEVVSFSSPVGQLTPVTGNDLTDANGLASVQLGAGQIADAGKLRATVEVNGVIIMAEAPIQSDGLATTGGDNNLDIVLDITITDSTPGVASSIITSVAGASVNLIIIDRIMTAFDGNLDTPIPNIEANITTSLGTISEANSATSSAVLTTVSDTDGAINFELAAGAILGSGEITVRVRDIEEVLPFEVGVAGLQIGTGVGATFVQGGLDIGVNPLSAGGTSVVSVTVVDANNVVVPGISIAFASTCTATIDGEGGFLSSISATSLSNSFGEAQALYEANGCEGGDIITATEAISGETASSNIQVFPPAVGNIVFRSVTDSSGNDIESIFFSESGGISTAEVTFQVLDTQGDPVEGQLVTFSLSTSVGGIRLEDVSGITGPLGFASAVVNAGFVQTPLTVTATIMFDTDNDTVNDTTRNSQSDLLSINSGVADFDSFTLSASQASFEAADRTDGAITLSVFLADKFNNPVPDGTTVSFRTEFGRVDPACNTVAGDCTVALVGINPKTPQLGEHQRLDTSSCPSDIIFEEVVPTTNGNTQFLARGVLRVEKNTAPASGTEDEVLALTTDYTVNGDETGITCVSANCTNETSLKVTYFRYPDEDNSGDTSHIFTNPGLATEPFRSFTNELGIVPCRVATIGQGGAVSSGYNGGLGQLYGIRSTVMAFALGEESFSDVNGNGVYDFGEVFIDLTEAFVDNNEDRVFTTGGAAVADSRSESVRECYGPRSPITDPNEVLGNCYQVGESEVLLDFDSSLSFQKGNGIYNGSSCLRSVDEDGLFCDNSDAFPCNADTSRYCSRTALNISQSLVIGFSGSSPVFGLTDITNGEFVRSVELTRAAGTLATLKSTTDVESNSGNTIAAGTPFSVGHGDSQVAPHIGDSATLSSFGNIGRLSMKISDIYNGHLPADATVGVTVADDGCTIVSADSGEIGNSDAVTIFLSPNATLFSGSSLVTVSITMPSSGLSTATSFTCGF